MIRRSIVVVAMLGCGGSPPPASPIANSTATQDLAQCRADLGEARAEIERHRTEIAEGLDALNERQAEVQARLDEIQRLQATPPPPRPRRAAPDLAATYAVPIDGDPVKGSATALVTIVRGYEYACPFCERSRATMDDLLKHYGSDLRIVYKAFVIHPKTATSTALAACAAHQQHQFEAMDEQLWTQIFHTRNFDKERCWADAAGCPQVETIAANLGLDVDRFKSDMQNTCMTQIQRDQKELTKVGVGATPAFFINGRFLSGAQPIDAFITLVDEELAKARARVGKGKQRGKRKVSAGNYYRDVILAEGLTELAPTP
jgi:protein-disulfide isomerase